MLLVESSRSCVLILIEGVARPDRSRDRFSCIENKFLIRLRYIYRVYLPLNLAVLIDRIIKGEFERNRT